MTKSETIKVEYFRLWDDNTWDTDFVEVRGCTNQHGVIQLAPLSDDPEDRQPTLDEAIRHAASLIGWDTEQPVLVGFYSLDEEEVEVDDELVNIEAGGEGDL